MLILLSSFELGFVTPFPLNDDIFVMKSERVYLLMVLSWICRPIQKM